MKMSATDNVALWLVLIGGINWGLIGFFEYNLVYELFGVDVSRWVYALVGLAAGYMVLMWLMKMSEKK